MKLDNWTFGITMLIVGMGGTLLTLWILSLLMSLLKQIFPYWKRGRREIDESVEKGGL